LSGRDGDRVIALVLSVTVLVPRNDRTLTSLDVAKMRAVIVAAVDEAYGRLNAAFAPTEIALTVEDSG
jgi:hypothetical protein